MGIIKTPCCKCGTLVTIDLSECEDETDGFAQWALGKIPGKGPKCSKC